MRNLRRTRKKGGLSVSIELECVPPFQTLAKCEAEFLKQNNFMRIAIPGDGNCFYHALSKYYQLSRAPGAPKEPTHLELRERVVQTIEDNIDEARVGLIVNITNIPNNINVNEREVLEMSKYLEALEDLREDGVWNSDNADVVSQYAARALNIRIKIFDKRGAQKSVKRLMTIHKNGSKVYGNVPAQPAKIVCYTFEPEGYMRVDTINLLRVGDGHYELLYPKGAAVAPKGRRITSKKVNNKNLVSNTVAKLAAVKLTNKKNNTAKRNNKNGPITRSNARATKVAVGNSEPRRKSLEDALKLVANMEKKEAAKKAAMTAKKAASSKTSKARTSSLENALMKIALQESEEQKIKNKERRKQLNNNFFKALEFASFE